MNRNAQVLLQPARMSGFVAAVAIVVAIGWAVAPDATDGRPGAATSLSRAPEARAPGAYGRLPLSFEANRGQTDARARFIARGAGSTVFLTREGATVSLTRSKRAGVAVGMEFAGASGAAPRGAHRREGTVNSFAGDDERDWVRGAPTFGRVEYPHLWKGIDGVFYANQRQLEYDLRVAPGADASQIELGFTGQTGARIAGNGDLVLDLPGGGTLRQLAPVSYQTVGGARRPVASRFVARSGGRVGIEVADYDRRRTLVVDPILAYSTYLGGSAADYGGSVVVDAAGSAYVLGSTGSTDFPTTVGAFDTSYDPGSLFVTKLNPAGTAPVYSTYLRGLTQDFPPGIAVDAAGSAYVSGFAGAGFPTTSGAYDTTLSGIYDAFVAKLDPTGGTLVYSTYLGGGEFEEGAGIAVDAAGSAYVTGLTLSADFPTTAGAFDTIGTPGDADAFVTKLNPAGSELVYSTRLGDTEVQLDGGADVAVDAGGNAYVAGVTQSPGFPITPGAFDTSLSGSGDGFVSKLDPSGSALVYSTFLGGDSDEYVRGIAIDAGGSAYVTGDTFSTDLSTPGAFDATGDASLGDAFVSKLSPSGSALTYSTYLGGSGVDNGGAIALDAAGSAYLTGTTSSTDFPTTAGAIDATGDTNADAFVTKLNPAGSALAYSTYLGSDGSDSGTGVAVDAAGSAYVTGTAGSGGFPTTVGAFDTSSNGNGDAFVAKLADAPTAVGYAGGRARVLRGGRGVRVRWRAGAGARIVSFDVLRVTRHGRVRVNRRGPIEGTTFGPARSRFSVTDPHGKRGSRYLIRAIYINGTRKTYGPYRATN